MTAFKSRRDQKTFFNKNRLDVAKYFRKGYRYHEVLPSAYYRNQTWGSLQKSWIGYCIAINK